MKEVDRAINQKRGIAIILLILSFIMALYSTLDYIVFILEKKYGIMYNLPFIHVFNDRVPIIGSYLSLDMIFLPYWVFNYFIFSLGFGIVLAQISYTRKDSTDSFMKKLRQKESIPLLMTFFSFLLITVLIPYIIQILIIDIYFINFFLLISNNSVAYFLFFVEFNYFSFLFFKSDSLKVKIIIIIIFPVIFLFTIVFTFFLLVIPVGLPGA